MATAEKKIHLKLITPEEVLVDEEVTHITAGTETGEIGILYDHAQMVARLGAAPLVYTLPKEAKRDKEVIAVVGGVIEVKNNEVTVITDFAQKGVDIDEAAAKKDSEKARTEYEMLKPGTNMDQRDLVLAEFRLKREMIKLKAAKLQKELN